MTIPCRHTGYTANKLIDEANQEKEPFDSYNVWQSVPGLILADDQSDYMLSKTEPEAERLVLKIEGLLKAEQDGDERRMAAFQQEIGQIIHRQVTDYARGVWEQA